MRFLSVVALFPLAAMAAVASINERAVNGHCSGTATGRWLSSGICVSTSSCTGKGGKYISGGCPYDGDNIKCCLVGLETSASTNPCGGISFCEWTSNGCSGSWITGSCPGGDNYKCCRR